MLNKSPRILLTIFLIIICSAITYFIENGTLLQSNEKNNLANSEIESNMEADAFLTYRLKGYRFIRPFLYSEKKTESSEFSNLKATLTNYIEQLKVSEKLITASVYLSEFDNGDWTSINTDETYFPGSLIKLPGLITYLKMAENDPTLLNKKLVFANSQKPIPNQTFNSKQIEPGKAYTIRELLKYMISYSDNNATYLLNKNVNLPAFHQLFADLQIPRITKENTTISAKNFSHFLQVLFSATYLTKKNSEFALELLEACDFKFGMVNGLPQNTIIAHKFGEMGDSTTRQLHESGIIYINNTPYLLTIMTKGYAVKDLPEIISNITRQVYQHLIIKQAN